MTNKKNKSKKELPLVSVCTPTFNRRPFIPYMIKIFQSQTYPKDKLEWIIVDDGTDPIEDLVKDIPNVKYFYYKDKMDLGKKRNTMHSKCTGEYICYMDDDDYYPPDRIEHAIKMLMDNPKYMIAGSSLMYTYFKHINKIYSFGPYGPNHATAATFVFKKQLLQKCKFENHAALAEERMFLKEYSIPLLQLDSKKTILVLAHNQNTYDKKDLLNRLEETRGQLTNEVITNFISDTELLDFYTNTIDGILDGYELGKVDNKPRVVTQIKELKEKREKMIQDHHDFTHATNKIMSAFNNPQPTIDIQQMKQNYEKQLSDKANLITQLLQRVKSQTDEIGSLKTLVDSLNSEISVLKNNYVV
jgi:glycosyltransferase involved in cell wall biosynthesis